MYISAREKKILNQLLKSNKYVSILELSELLDVSSRTIHRQIKLIEEVLQKFDLRLIKSPKKGMSIEGSFKNINLLKERLLEVFNEYTLEERLDYIIATLLKEDEAVKLLLFADDLNVSIGTISSDLTKVEEYLKDFGIKVIRKQGLGIVYEGSEEQIRRVLTNIVARQINEYEFLELNNNLDAKIKKNKYNNFYNIITLKEFMSVKNIIKQIEHHNYLLTDNSFMMLTIHISVLINRVMGNKKVVIEISDMNNLKNVNEYPIAVDIVNKVKKEFGINLNDHEIAYLTTLIQKSRFKQRMTDWLEENNLNILAATRRLIHYVSRKLVVNFINDEQLYQSLLTHLIPAVHRASKEIIEKNPLVNQIKEQWPTLFKIIQKGMIKYFPELSFSDHEIAYVVLYFGSTKVLYEKEDEFRALVICSSGMGTSKMLASRIKQEIRQIKYVDTFDLYGLKKANVRMYDIVISTIDMPDFHTNYLLVNPLLNNIDIENIQSEIKKIIKFTTLEERLFNKRILKKEKDEKKVVDFKNSLEKISNLSIYTKAVTNVLQKFKNFTLNISHQTSKDLLVEICEILVNEGLVKDGSKLKEDILKREKKGGIAIPDTKMALYHCQTNWVEEPLFCSFILKEKLKLKAMDGNEVYITKALLLITPKNLHNTQLEVLGVISSTIIEDKESINVFTNGNEKEIKEKLIYTFEKEIKMKLER